MKHFLAIGLLTLSLGGCAGTLPSINNPVTPLSLYDIKATYAIAQAGADVYIQRYRQGLRCTTTKLESVTNLCSRRSIVVRMQTADRQAQIALGRADLFIAQNPTLNASSVVAAAQAAVATFYTIQQGNP